MAAAVVAGAAAGAALEIAFNKFLDAIVDVIKKNAIFQETLQDMAETLNSMRPHIKRIEALDKDSDRRKLEDLMNKGEKLVLKCGGIHSCDVIKKYRCSNELLKLNASILRYISTVLQVQQAADQTEILCLTREWNDRLDRIRELQVQQADRIRELESGLVGGCTPPSLKEDPVALGFPLRDLKRKFFEEDVRLVVLSAPAGCGKTTLATAFCQDGEVKEKFKENMLFVNVSKATNVIVIAQKLFQRDGVKPREFQSEEDALNQLEDFFSEMEPVPILLVLDDLSPTDGSIHLLEKFKFRMKNYKILVTSRYKFQSFGTSYELPRMSDADIETLFLQSALPPNDKSVPDSEAKNEILKSCGRIPLVISVIGKSLRGKRAAEWRKRAKECSDAANILSNFESELLARLQSSVDCLDEKVKECFMDLGSFPKNQRIPACSIIDMWMELRELDEDDAISILYELSDKNLLDLLAIRKDASEDDGLYNEHFVVQHALLRELAIHQSNSESIEHTKRLFVDLTRKQIPAWLKEPQQLTIKAKLLSISTDQTFSSSWWSMQAPEVEVLFLNFHSENYTLPEFMEGMDKLKVLIVTNSGPCPMELSNISFLGSLPNLKRIRLEKLSIPSFFLPSKVFQKLEKMSLVMCNIDKDLKDHALHISEAMPNLVEINIDYCGDLEELPPGFCYLIQLRRLSITNCHELSKLPEEIGRFKRLEVLRLNSCVKLLELPPAVGSLHKLTMLDLSECLSLKKLPEEIGELYNLRKLYMIECSGCELPDTVKRLVHLREVIGDEETANSWKLFEPDLPNLATKVHKDPNLKWLFESL